MNMHDFIMRWNTARDPREKQNMGKAAKLTAEQIQKYCKMPVSFEDLPVEVQGKLLKKAVVTG